MSDKTRVILKAIGVVLVFQLVIIGIGYLFFSFINYSLSIAGWNVFSRFSIVVWAFLANLYLIGRAKQISEDKSDKDKMREALSDLIRKHAKEN